MITIPAGSVTLRDARTESARTVDVRPFELARTTVTDAGALPVHPVTWFAAIKACNDASRADGRSAAYQIDGRTATWRVEADGCRLPTEAAWEFACRAGTTTPTYGRLANTAWTADDAVDGPQPVGAKAPNAIGLADMLDNVWEWCWDYADTARYGDDRALRGGGWADRPWSLRASVRRGSAPDAVLDDVGFRFARGAVGEAGTSTAQGWSADADRERAAVRGPLPVGWTPLRELLGE
ncbi:MAG: formylglycine-generating enzyme family protein [Pseudoclavibacter sp.]